FRQPVVRILGAVDEFGPDRCRDRIELLDRRPTELRRRLPHELGPTAADGLLTLGRRGHPHQPLFESTLGQFALERLLDDEDRADTMLPQVISEGDEVVRRPPRAGFWEQCDGRLAAHTGRIYAARRR